MYALIFLLLLLPSCSSDEAQKFPAHPIEIQGRASSIPLYKAEVPSDWLALPESKNLEDSREALASWKTGECLIYFHNFPGELRIDPLQQIERWKKQMGPLDSEEVVIVSHGGFGGFLLEAYSKDKGVIAYAFKMNDGHYQKLTRQNRKEERADWTIKATGPKACLEELKPALDHFVESLELIEPIR